MSSTAAPDHALMLKYPRKNFAFLPSNGFIIGFFLFIFLVVGPFIQFLYQFLAGLPISNGEYYLNGMRTLFFLWFAWQVIFNGFARWNFSKRVRYTRTHLIPFINQKYGITIETEHAAAIICQQPFTLGKDKLVQFDGWQYLEAYAVHQHLREAVMDVNEHLMLIVEGGHELNEQFKNAPFHSSDDVFTIPKDSSMGESHLVHLAMLNILDNLPTGTDAVFNVINRHGKFIDIPASMQVSVHNDNLKYSPHDLGFFVDAIAANVAKNDSSLLTIAFNQTDEKPTYHGIVFTANGFDFLNDKDFDNMFNNDSSHVQYNKDYDWFEFISRNQ